MSDLIAPQPDPIANDLPASWDLVMQDMLRMVSGTKPPESEVLKDMKGRDAFGLRKYGVRIQPCNGRDNLVDAYQEILDSAVYLRSSLFELERENHPETSQVQGMYREVLSLLLRLRLTIWNRDPK